MLSALLSSPLLAGSSVSELGASNPGADSTETQGGGEQGDTEGCWQVSTLENSQFRTIASLFSSHRLRE